MLSQKTSISDKIIDLFLESRFRYNGVPVNIFGLPTFSSFKRQSVYNALAILKRKNYVENIGPYLRLASRGQAYVKRRQDSLKSFESTAKDKSIKNLLVMFDVPEERKAGREWLRWHLKKFGYMMIQRSVWVGPLPLPKEFTEYLREIKLQSCIKTFKLAKSYSVDR